MREARAHGKWAHDSTEYKMVRKGKRVVREHILILERLYGRPLIQHLGLYGHHKDGNKRNNEDFNIQPVTPVQHYHVERGTSLS